MVPSIARQSVILKCRTQKSVLLGNYEFYYAAGLLKKLYQMEISGDMEPETLFEQVLAGIEQVKPQDKKEEFLIHMVKNYKLQKEYDDDTKVLFRWGENEEYIWQITTPQICT